MGAGFVQKLKGTHDEVQTAKPMYIKGGAMGGGMVGFLLTAFILSAVGTSGISVIVSALVGATLAAGIPSQHFFATLLEDNEFDALVEDLDTQIQA